MRKNFFQSVKEIFRDWDLKVMSYVMLVVTATCVITATVAWFTCSAYASVRNMEIKTGDTEVIKLAVKEGNEDVEVLRENGEDPRVSISMPVFTGVTQVDGDIPVFAPGTYGSFTIYVTPMKTNVTACKVLPSFFGSKEDQSGLTYMTDNLSDEEKEVIEQLVKGHILLFTNYNETTGYSGLLTDTTPLTVELGWDKETNKGIEEAITIYWYWPYEYEDLPAEAQKLDEAQLLDPYRQAEDKYSDSRLYDFADTRIGTNVKNVKIHFEVSAVYGNN